MQIVDSMMLPGFIESNEYGRTPAKIPLTPHVTVTAGAQVKVLATMATVKLRVRVEKTEAILAYQLRQEAVDTVRRVLKETPELEMKGEEIQESDTTKSWSSLDGHIYRKTAEWSCQIECNTNASREDGVSANLVREQLREFVARLASVENVDVLGPFWTVEDGAVEAFTSQARHEALASAAKQVNSMVAPFGQKIGRVLTTAIDTSTDQSDQFPEFQDDTDDLEDALYAESLLDPLPERTLELDLKSPHRTISASVKATFELADSDPTA